MSNSELTDKVVEYINDNLSPHFDQFFTANCGEFDEKDENKLSYTTLYQTYKADFEAKLEGFLSEQGSSVSELLAQIKDRNEREGADCFALQLIDMMASFENFKDFMLQAKEEKQSA